jgi:tetratricopeptide (TPR) repeat protein
MPTATEQAVMEIQLALDTSGTDKGIRKLNQGWSKGMRAIEKASQKSMKGTGKAVAEFWHKLSGAQKKYAPLMAKAEAAQKDLGKAIEKTTDAQNASNASLKAGQKFLAQLAAAQKKLGQASDSASVAEREFYRGLEKDAEDHVKSLEKEVQGYERLKEAQEEAVTQAKEAAAEIGEQFTFNTDELIQAAESAGDELVEPFAAFMQKDFKRAIQSSAKLLGKGLGGLGKGASKGGGALLGKAGEMMKGGAASKVAGAGVGALGGIMKGMGGFLSMVSKLGPLIGIVSGAVAGLVKLFIDAEATVKEINKEILATSSTVGFLSQNMGDVEAAAYDLDSTLKRVSSAALSLDNIGWGISKETHTQVISALTAEGVSLKTLDNQFGSLNKKTQEYSDSFGSITQMAVTYSRLMGVSLGEITALQGEMMTEMGASLTDVQTAFHQMGAAAADSGITANKFFSIIRGVSSDLALYNTRMEDAVKLLGMLGNVMSPRNAAKFMSTAMNAMKGMGRIQRLQTTLLAGGGKKEVERDLTMKIKDISGKLGMTPEDLEKAVKSGNREQVDVALETLKKTDPEAVGALSEAVDKVSMQFEMSQKGVYGQAQAAGEMGPAGQLAMMQKALAKWGGGKTLRSGVGSIGMEQMAENLGVSREQLDQMIIFEGSIEKQRKQMIKNAKADKKYNGDEDKRAAEIKRLTEAGTDQIFNEMGQGDKDKIEADKKAAADEAKFAKDQGKNVSTIMDKIGVLVDFMMGQFYDAISGIWDLLASSSLFTAPGGAAKKERSAGDAQLKKDIAAAEKSLGEAKTDQQKQDAAKELAILKDIGEQRKKQTEQLAQNVLDAQDKADKAQEAANKAHGLEEIANTVDALEKAKEEVEKAKTAQVSAVYGPRSEERKTAKLTEIGKRGTDIDKMVENLKSQVVAADPADSAAFDKITTALQKLQADKATLTEEAKAVAEEQTKANPDAAKAATAGVTGGSLYTHDITAEEAANEQGDTLDLILKQLRNKGIKIEKFVGDHVKNTIHDAVLDAAREALVEYYILTKQTDTDVLKSLQDGMSSQDIMAKGLKQTQDTGKVGLPLVGNADGGLVTGVREGIASVAKGEAIVPAGGAAGGGGPVKVELSLKGDLGRIIDARADDRYAVNKSREKFR